MATHLMTFGGQTIGDAVLPVSHNSVPDRTAHPLWHEWTPYAGARRRRKIGSYARPWIVAGELVYNPSFPGRWSAGLARLQAIGALYAQGDPVTALIPLATGSSAASKWTILAFRRGEGTEGVGPYGITRAMSWRLELEAYDDATD